MTGTVAGTGCYRGQVLDGVNSNIALEQATVFGQPLTGLYANAWVAQEHPHELRLRLGRGSLFGGQLLAEAHVAFGAGLQYEVDLKAIGVRLEEVAKHNHIGGNAHMSGLAKAELYLRATGYGVDELSGGGNIHVPDGKIYNLPLVLDLLKVITALHIPDGTAFEEAHAEFKIQGKRHSSAAARPASAPPSASAARANWTSTVRTWRWTSTPSGATSRRCCRPDCVKSRRG